MTTLTAEEEAALWDYGLGEDDLDGACPGDGTWRVQLAFGSQDPTNVSLFLSTMPSLTWSRK